MIYVQDDSEFGRGCLVVFISHFNCNWKWCHVGTCLVGKGVRLGCWRVINFFSGANQIYLEQGTGNLDLETHLLGASVILWWRFWMQIHFADVLLPLCKGISRVCRWMEWHFLGVLWFRVAGIFLTILRMELELQLYNFPFLFSNIFHRSIIYFSLPRFQWPSLHNGIQRLWSTHV